MIYKGMGGNSRAKGGAGFVLNKKYKRFTRKWISIQKNF